MRGRNPFFDADPLLKFRLTARRMEGVQIIKTTQKSSAMRSNFLADNEKVLVSSL